MLKKSAIAIAMGLVMGTAAQAAVMDSGTFTMYGGGPGGLVGQYPDVTGTVGGGTWAVASASTFFGLLWTAHSGATFGPGTYSIDTIEGGTYAGLSVGAGQVGGHILFNYGATINIDVVNIWDVACAAGSCTYTSTDINGDGVLGIGMIDGAFPGFRANFDFVAPEVSQVPVPAAVWLFGSGLLGLVGVARRKKSA